MSTIHRPTSGLDAIAAQELRLEAGGRSPGSDVVRCSMGDEEIGSGFRKTDRRLFDQHGCGARIEYLPGGTHPGTEHGPMRRLLVVRMMRFMRDGLRRGQPADDEKTDNQQDGDGSFYLQASHRRIPEENLMANATGLGLTESRSPGVHNPLSS